MFKKFHFLNRNRMYKFLRLSIDTGRRDIKSLAGLHFGFYPLSDGGSHSAHIHLGKFHASSSFGQHSSKHLSHHIFSTDIFLFIP
jgi:hypothetical protein